jgi:capsular polysaccharide biosynthesis protein
MSDVQARSSQPPPPDWAVHTLAAEFEPLPQVGPLQAARRYWFLILLPVLVFVPLAAIVAAKRPATYTAEARLIVGRLNISTAGAIQGFAGAAQDLASTYPLVIYAAGVVNPVAHELGTTPGDVISRLTATEVPSTSIVRVIATGRSANDAVTLANAASHSLVSFLTKFDRDSPDLAYLHKQLRSAELAYQRASAAFARASIAAARNSSANTSTALSAGNTTPPLSPALQRLAAAEDVAKIQLGAISTDYQNTVQSQATSSLLQPLVDAHSASSDRQSKLQISVFIALLAGLLVGLALATLRANQMARRTLMAPSWAPEGSGPTA